MTEEVGVVRRELLRYLWTGLMMKRRFGDGICIVQVDGSI